MNKHHVEMVFMTFRKNNIINRVKIINIRTHNTLTTIMMRVKLYRRLQDRRSSEHGIISILDLWRYTNDYNLHDN